MRSEQRSDELVDRPSDGDGEVTADEADGAGGGPMGGSCRKMRTTSDGHCEMTADTAEEHI